MPSPSCSSTTIQRLQVISVKLNLPVQLQCLTWQKRTFGLGALVMAAMVALALGTKDSPLLLGSAMMGMSVSVCAALLWPARTGDAQPDLRMP